MSSGNILLKMLEPAVRPDGVAAPVRAPAQPIETRSFDSFLHEARQMNIEQTVPSDECDTTKGALGPLSHIDQVANASLRDLIAGRHMQANQSETSHGTV